MAVYPTHTLTLLALLGTTSATALAGQACPEGEVSSILVNAHSIFDTDASTDEGTLPWSITSRTESTPTRMRTF
jgi:hypothetical protein